MGSELTPCCPGGFSPTRSLRGSQSSARVTLHYPPNLSAVVRKPSDDRPSCGSVPPAPLSETGRPSPRCTQTGKSLVLACDAWAAGLCPVSFIRMSRAVDVPRDQLTR